MLDFHMPQHPHGLLCKESLELGKQILGDSSRDGNEYEYIKVNMVEENLHSICVSECLKVI